MLKLFDQLLAPVASLARKAATARQQSLFVLTWLVPSWILIGMSALLIWAVPIRRLTFILGVNMGPVAKRVAATPRQQARAVQIGRAVRIAANYAPFRSDCLRQSMAAKLSCRMFSVPCALYLGVEAARADRGMSAHGWTSCGPVVLTGGAQSFATYVPLACFVPNKQSVMD